MLQDRHRWRNRSPMHSLENVRHVPAWCYGCCHHLRSNRIQQYGNTQYSFWLQVGAKVKCPDSFGISDLRQNTYQIWRTWFRDFKMRSYIHRILYTFVWLQALKEQVSSSSTWGVCGQWFFFRNLKCWGSMCCSDGRSENPESGVAEAGQGEVPANQVTHTSRCPNCIVGWLQVSTWFFGSATPWFSNDVDPWSIFYILVVGFSEFHFWRRPCPSASKTVKCWKEKLVDCLPKDRVSDIVVCNSTSNLHTIKISRCAPCSSGKKSTFYRSPIEIISVHALVFSAILAPLQWRTPR